MTRRDFELIAKTIGTVNIAPQDRIAIARSFASVLYNSNPKFDSKKFVDRVCEYISE